MATTTTKVSDVRVVDYTPSMLDEMMTLFYNSVHSIAVKDYNQQQLNRWAPASPDINSWTQRLKNNQCKVAVIDNVVVGFAELTSDGHVDTMYVHKDHQRKQIAFRLLEQLLEIAVAKNYAMLTTEASITAKPFFEKQGFKVTRVKKKLYNGKEFINYEMLKEL